MDVRVLPEGTVTLLFTDIEGSTRLLDRIGPEQYARALTEHRERLRGAFARHGGVEVDTQGDAFFVAFPDAVGAAAGAAAGQEALRAGEIRVRMALHTGSPTRTDEGYVGMDVHRGARLCSTAHGGQVVLSEVTRGLLHADTDVRDLGLHRLKDLAQPEKVFQLGQADFPALRSLDATNLPSQPSHLIGRESEVADLVRLLGEHRLVTLTGPGGTGKTRLALQVAAELVGTFADGVFWVPLAPVTTAADVLSTVAATLGAKGDLTAHIGARRMLLLLDNLEQVLACAPDLAALQRSCPRLHLLVSSRAPLRIDGEQEYGVQPLPADDAEALFRERARVPGPPDVVTAICERLDRLPLAIELAAARTALLPPAELLSRLEQRLPLLTGGRRDAPERQRTLRRTIEWSHELLSPEEQRTFARLAVFAGSCEVSAAEQVADADVDVLQSLMEQSLLRRWDTGRIGMLETIREYAGERLEASGEAEQLRLRHLQHLLALAERAGLTDEAAVPAHEQLVLPEMGNVRVALAWAAESGQAEVGVRLVVLLEHLWVASYPFEGVMWLDRLMGHPLPDDLRASALKVAGGLTFIVGRFEEGARLYEQSLELYRSLGDDRGTAVLLFRMANYWITREDLVRARAATEESLDLLRGSAFRKEMVVAEGTMGLVLHAEGAVDEGLEQMLASADAAAGLGHSWWQHSMLVGAAERLVIASRFDEAERVVRTALPGVHRADDRMGRVFSLALLASTAAATGRSERAGVLWAAVEREEAAGEIGQWEHERSDYEAGLPKDDEDFERGRAAGRALDQEAAVAYALALSPA